MSYYVDGWTEDYAPTTSNANLGKTTGGSNNWDWYYGSAGVDSGYVQVNATTRRYWYKYRTAGYTFLRLFVYTLPGTMTDKSAEIYKPMVSFGSALADWQEAAEDTADSISAAGNTANAAKTAADTANSTANSAKTTASEAGSAAKEAKTTANAANSTANAAKTAASEAGKAADEAKTAAEKATALSGGINCLLGTLAPVTINGNGASAASEMNYILSEYPGSDTAHGKGGYASGTTICLSFDYDATKYTEGDVWFAIRSQAARRPFEMGKSGHSALVFTLDADTWRGTGGSLVLGGKWTGSITLSHVMWGFGASEQPWGLAAEERELDYLRSALTEATEAQTSITGGLLLSKLIGVKSSSGVVVSGINGTDTAVGGNLPMMWAGATGKDTWNNAAFRVYNSGHVDMGDVSITSAGGSGTVKIQNGQVSASNGSYKTIVTSDTMGSISTAISGSAKQTQKTIAADTTMIATDRVESENLQPVTIELNDTVTLWSFTPTKAATLIIPSFRIIFKLFDGGQEPSNQGYKNATYMSANFKLQLSVGGAVYNLAVGNTKRIGLGENAPDITVSVSAQNFEVSANTKITMSVYGHVGGSVRPNEKLEYNDREDDSSSWIFVEDWGAEPMAQFQIPSAFTCVIKEGEYRNSYYADGIFLQGSESKVFAVNTFRDSEILRLRSGSSLMKFTADGLMQSLNGGATFVRPPLLFRVTYANYNFTATCVNLGKGYGCTRESAGKFTLTHSLGTSNYMAFAQTVHSSNQSSQWYDFAKVISKSSTAITVWIFDRDGSIRDDDCEVAIFRW